MQTTLTQKKSQVTTEDRVIEIEPVEEVRVEVLPELGVLEDFGMPLSQIFPGRDDDAAGTGGRAADDVGRLGRCQRNH